MSDLPLEPRFAAALEKLKKFRAREGHCNVPSKHKEDGFGLGVWVSNQRSYRNFLKPNRSAALEQVPGWYWNCAEDMTYSQDNKTRNFNLGNQSDKFTVGIMFLKQFVKREGHANVPASHLENGFRLGAWVILRRHLKKIGKLPIEHIVALELFPGWQWSVGDNRFQRGLERLKQFIGREGHARVPFEHVEDGFNLGFWVQVQRRFYKEGTIKSDRVVLLESFPAWKWHVGRGGDFQFGAEKLRQFFRREGHAVVPFKHVEDGLKLGRWIQSCRRSYERGTITPERVAKLESVPGWQWSSKAGPKTKAGGRAARTTANRGSLDAPR